MHYSCPMNNASGARIKKIIIIIKNKKKKQPKTHLCENADTIQTKPYYSFLIVNYYINWDCKALSISHFTYHERILCFYFV